MNAQLLIASTGGHLTQLVRIRPTLGVAARTIWATFDSPQSRSLLRNEEVIWLDYIKPRDLGGVVRAYATLERSLRDLDIDRVVSTGAAAAIAGFAWARRHGVPAHYIESVSRFDGPSLTGRLVAAFRLADLQTQHASWANRRWRPRESVLSTYASERLSIDRPVGGRQILVSLGTIRPYRFDRLVDRVLAIMDPEDRVIWQLGVTSRSDLPGEAHTMLSAETMREIAAQSDVVITHAGVGTILELLELGVAPIVVPRSAAAREHVDDHQSQICHALRELGVGFVAEVDELTSELLDMARATRTVARTP